jgi:hypothetical protein
MRVEEKSGAASRQQEQMIPGMPLVYDYTSGMKVPLPGGRQNDLKFERSETVEKSRLQLQVSGCWSGF